MRLSPQNIAALREAIGSIAPDAAAIRLFGSRLDDEVRGGDVDLMIDFDHPVEHPAALEKAEGQLYLWLNLYAGLNTLRS